MNSPALVRRCSFESWGTGTTGQGESPSQQLPNVISSPVVDWSKTLPFSVSLTSKLRRSCGWALLVSNSFFSNVSAIPVIVARVQASAPPHFFVNNSNPSLLYYPRLRRIFFGIVSFPMATYKASCSLSDWIVIPGRLAVPVIQKGRHRCIDIDEMELFTAMRVVTGVTSCPPIVIHMLTM